jgi:hypothetical protein
MGRINFSGPGHYRIEVQGELGSNWSDRLGGLRVFPSSSDKDDKVTAIEGRISDQAALVGVLNTLYELHLPLLSVRYLDETKAGLDGTIP